MANETVEITVDGVNKFGTGLVSDDVWYNQPKGKPPIFGNVNNGDTVLLTMNRANKVIDCQVISTGVSSSGSSSGNSTGSSKGGWGNQPVISFQAARNTAIQFVKNAIDVGAISLGNKAAAAKMSVFEAAVNEYTLRFGTEYFLMQGEDSKIDELEEFIYMHGDQEQIPDDSTSDDDGDDE